MKRRYPKFIVAVFLLAFLRLQISAQQNNPRFEDYPVKAPREQGPSASIYRARDIGSEREYGKKAREAAKDGPNFAGHFAIVTSSCGMKCINLSVVNTKTGKNYRVPFGAIGDVPCSTGSREFSEIVIDYRLNSRLLILKGHFETYADREDSGCSTRYYLWKGTHFLLIRKTVTTVK